jgi:hypothetical protein
MDEIERVGALLEGDELPDDVALRVRGSLRRVIEDEPHLDPQHRLQPSRRRGTVASRPRKALVVLVAAALLGILLVQIVGGSTMTVTTTPYLYSHPLPRPEVVAPSPKSSDGWHLAALITGWTLNPEGPRPGTLICPTTEVCYLTGNSSTSASGPPDFDTLYVTYNGAASWSSLAVPKGAIFTTHLTCWTVTDCAAGALLNGQPSILMTLDGAHQWNIRSLPADVGALGQLACLSASQCYGQSASGRNPWKAS